MNPYGTNVPLMPAAGGGFAAGAVAGYNIIPHLSTLWATMMVISIIIIMATIIGLVRLKNSERKLK